jgi:tetratricopeptide (TPR) repeat protein
MTMADFFNSGSDPLEALSQDTSGQRAQLALYAIQQAAGYLQSNKIDSAIKEFKKALAFDPQNVTAHTYIGNIYLSQGKTQDAIKEFKSVVQNDRTSVTALNNLGNAYLQAKQYSDAEKSYKTATRLDPLSPLADYTLGILYTQTDRSGEAEAQFKKVAKVSPRDGNVYYALGALYNKTGRPEEAVKNLEKALTLKPNFPAANFELGSAYAKVGNTDMAQKQLSILATKDSNFYNSLSSILNTPKMLYIDSANNKNFNQLLGPRTPLWMLDPTLMDANASSKIAVAIQFNNKMDIASVMNPANWEISRASNTEGGYYNNTTPTNAREVSIPKRPFSVNYNPTTGQAIVTFTVQQNADGDATIDPKHLVFKFSGKDSSGRQMDTTGDQIDGYAAKAF